MESPRATIKGAGRSTALAAGFSPVAEREQAAPHSPHRVPWMRARPVPPVQKKAHVIGKAEKLMDRDRIEEIIRRLNPRLEELSEGYVQLVGYDETTGILTLMTYGGRLL